MEATNEKKPVWKIILQIISYVVTAILGAFGGAQM